MREKVCIVLNEREANKNRAASMLEARLLSSGITSSRIEIDEIIAEKIKARMPLVLILDYLLGDFSTGLDILTELGKLPAGSRPKTIFLTDEPSVQVAVEAMRLGAINYFELDNPQSIELAAREALRALEATNSEPEGADAEIVERTYSIDDLVSYAPATREMLSQARALAIKGAPLIVLLGREGTGRATLARAIAREDEDSFLLERDLRACSDDLEHLFGWKCGHSERSLQLGRNMSVSILHAEEDTGELLDLIAGRFDRIWSGVQSGGAAARLLINTSCERTAQAWRRAIPTAELIRIPALGQRREDIPPLVQRFIKEAEQLASRKIEPFAVDVVEWLSSLDWLQDIKQLRSAVIDAAITATFSDAEIREILEAHRERWAAETALGSQRSDIEPLFAARMLEICNFNYRIAATRLGCSAIALQKTLGAARGGQEL